MPFQIPVAATLILPTMLAGKNNISHNKLYSSVLVSILPTFGKS